MKKDSLQSELFAKGLVEKGDIEEIQKFKRERNRKRTNQNNKAYLKDKKVKSLVFTTKEYQRLADLAKEHKMPEATFLKACIFGYIDSVYINADTHTVKNISNLLLSIKNHVLESLRYVHLNQSITYQDIQAITQQITDLELFITSTLSNSPRLSVWLQRQQEKDEHFIANLLVSVSQLLKASR